MAAQKFLSLVSGRIQQVIATIVSAGAEDDGKLVALDATGKIDVTMMPVGVGADTTTLVASEALASGDFVNIWDDAGTPKMRKADSTAAGKEADGFVKAAVLSAASGTVYFEGSNTSLTGLTVGARYYLSAAAPGTATATPPATSSNVVQYIGRAISTTAISFEATDGVILA